MINSKNMSTTEEWCFILSEKLKKILHTKSKLNTLVK